MKQTRKPATRLLRIRKKPVSARHKRQTAAIRHAIRRARPLHKKFLLHPATVMMLLVAGVFFVGWTFKAVADDYTITAKVQAPVLTEGATITSPADGAVFTASPIDVTGTCPDNSYVKLTRNGVFSGAANCAADHTFTITTSLSDGTNDLNAQDYNVTDDPGPATTDVTVTYNPPAPPPSSGSSGGGQSSGGSGSSAPEPPLLSSDYHFQGTTVGSAFTWELTLHGGATPYDVNVDWGDNQTSRYTVPAEQAFTISHTYRTVGYFTVKVKATDAKGQITLLQLFAYIKPIITPNGAITEIGNLPPTVWGTITKTITESHWLWLAWPIYITVALMAISYWLGEREAERSELAARTQKHAHR